MTVGTGLSSQSGKAGLNHVKIETTLSEITDTIQMDVKGHFFFFFFFIFLLSLSLLPLQRWGVCLGPSLRGSHYFLESLYPPGR
jgi:hypothetical protein